MKTIACKDAGMDCDFVAEDKTDEGVIAQAVEHVKMVHPDKMMEMKTMPPDKMTNMVRSLIKEQ